MLPSIKDVPYTVPAVDLWDFRMAISGTQGALWASIGLLFGPLIERARREPRDV